jgi:signal transduction histidine kinase
MEKKANHRTYLSRLLLFLFMLLSFMLSVSLVTVQHLPELMTADEVAGFDFVSKEAKLDRNLFSFYAEKLYTPEDFASGQTGQPSFTTESSNNNDRQFIRYGTYRLTISLPAGHVFALSGDSATYSQKIWVNGKVISEVGTVADNAEDFVPRTKYYTVCFTSTDQPTEIVIQRANFVHQSGTLFEIDLGEQNIVQQAENLKLFRSIIGLGILFTGFLFFLGISFFFPGRKEYLWFSLACLSLCIRNSFVSPKPVMVLFPELNWYLGHRLECCSMIFSYFFLLLFYNYNFKNIVPKWFRHVGYALCMLGIGIYLLLPSTIYSKLTADAVHMMIAYLAVYTVAFFYELIHKKIYFKSISFNLMLTGFLVTTSCSIVDGVLYRITRDYNLNQIGMLIFVFLNEIALAIQMRQAEDSLNEANLREKEMARKNKELSDLYSMRTELLSDISHELRTPLTVISSYAGLTKMQIEKNAVNTETMAHLNIIQQEAVRLGSLVEQLKTVSAGTQKKTMAPMEKNIYRTLCKAAEFCKPICDKNSNVIEVISANHGLEGYYAADSIMQVLINLISNSTRHCFSSVILLKAEKADDMIKVSVSDHGDGMSKEQLAHVLERGVSGDHSTGIGLSLCRTIIESSGGTIHIDSTLGMGTTVQFTLPEKGNTE